MMKKLFLLLLFSLVLTACGERIKPDTPIDADVGAVDETAADNEGASGGRIDDGGLSGGEKLADGRVVSYDKEAIFDGNNVLAERLIHFDFDSDEVPQQYLELIRHHGRYLSFNPDVKMRLEGHADERGTREYNVALAEKRAQAVKQLMLLEGAADDQISIVSYGEEKPVAFGHDEESWQLNRRVEIIYP